MNPATEQPFNWSGRKLTFYGVLIAFANFMAVLDMTIANVSISNIAGSLAISPTEGTHIITSYAVAEAIAVPLTGWMAKRFGETRVFIYAMVIFGVFSFLCGIAPSLTFLIIARICQGLAGGPLMPLSQSLLLKIYPKEKHSVAFTLWSITTLLAPVCGPIVGGYLCDELSWPYIFYVNIPFVVICSFFLIRVFKQNKPVIYKEKTDFVGLLFLVVWVVPLQIMLDKGRELDWFNSNFISTLGIITFFGFLIFLIWEMKITNPIINLRVFRHKGYTVSIITLALAFGSYFGTVVLLPLWLQNFMGYTASRSGFVSAAVGITALLVAPFAAKIGTKYDARLIVFISIIWLGAIIFLRSLFATNIDVEQITFPMFLQGIGLPFLMISLTNLALASVDPTETTSAAGLFTFARTLSCAFATSILTTMWERKAIYFHAELANIINAPPQTLTATALVDKVVQQQSVMLSLNYVFAMIAITLIVSSFIVWFAPKLKNT